jgi:hypothetical protein
VRSALVASSSLLPKVEDGMRAVKSSDGDCFHADVKSAFADSIDLDEAMKPGRDEENRWDYLLGHSASRTVIGVEPHSAKEDQVSTVIKKRKAAVEQLRPHLAAGKAVASWLWVASGNVQFADTEKTKLRLAQNGIEFVGKQVLPKHLPGASSVQSPAKAKRKPRR